MTSQPSRDLGHGVRVQPGEGDGIVVLSETLDLGWRQRAGGRPGSAVTLEGRGFEVVDRQPWRRGDRWGLEPWSGEDVMRVVSPLDEATVAAAAETAQNEARAAGLKPALWLLSPILGFAVAPWQRRWRDDWTFPAATATTLSAILEMLFGATCLVEFISAMGAGASVFPWIPRPLVFMGLYLFVEGFVRLAQVFSDSEPVGTFFGLVLSGFERSRVPAPEPERAPEIEAHDDAGGTLKLLSPVQRRDWEIPGLLFYRGEAFALGSTTRLGESWVYVFERVEVAEDFSGPRLRLLPPATKAEGFEFEDSPGAVKTVLLTIACTLAPARYQERWAEQIGVRNTLFTLFGASAELVGGLSNLSAGVNSSPPAVALNLFFVIEAAARFGWVIFRGRPLGSVFGLVLTPLLDALVPGSDQP